MKPKKIIAIASVVVVTGLIAYGYMMYRNIFAGNTKFDQKEVYVEIPTGSDYEAVKAWWGDYYSTKYSCYPKA